MTLVYHEIRWTEKKIGQRLELIAPLVYRKRSRLAPFRFTEQPDPMAAPPITADDSDWIEVEAGDYWGAPWLNFSLRGAFTVPEGWDDGVPVALYLPLGEAGDFSHPEALAYIDGEPYAAADRHHQEIALPEKWRDGAEHSLVLHGWTGLMGWTGTDPAKRLQMHECAVVQIDQPTRDFVAEARVALGVAANLDENHPARAKLLNALDEAFKVLDTRDPLGEERFYASVPEAHKVLKAGIAKAGPPIDAEIFSTGHAHIDVAWLWTLGQTRQKSGRTFYNVLRLMEQFPHYHFTQSQPQLYDYLKEDFPALFEEIKGHVAEGRWEPIGGMWVEADCNISGPESLARQFLLGRTFFRDHFGPDADSPLLWLPDVFGYAWNLPQLIKLAGLDYFFTIKIGWSQYNRFPFDSFWWQGLDGTRILTHFSTTREPDSPYASTYNANASPEQVIGTWINMRHKEAEDVMLMAYGYGDGGGGPTREMLENIEVLNEFPGVPRTHQGSVIDFFRELEDEAGDALPVWNGELYLEYHRGTYTTQARNKRANRKSEFLLHDAELFGAWASLLDADYDYPAGTFDEAWKIVCLNQFHDIIPGSSIGPVYDESLEQYKAIQDEVTAAREGALAPVVDAAGGDVVLVNPAGFARNDAAFWAGELPAGKKLIRPDGEAVTVQPAAGGAWIAAGELPPMSATPLTFADGEAEAENALKASADLLENALIRVEFNDAGDIIRIYDKANDREILPEGAVANEFQAFEDRPMFWDAWDIDIYYDDKMWTAEPAESVEVIEEGPARAALKITRPLGESVIVQTISLGAESAQITFDTFIDWRERHTLLKVAFPVDVLSPKATYEIQWGNVERPTHRNTSWDWARFETCAQKWVDLGEGGYGVSLLNDCKYGHDIRDNVMRISLLRSPTMPDPNADQGEHRFTYALLPHAGSWTGSTIPAAYALNDPLIAASGAGTDPNPLAMLSVDRPNVVIETVKRAEDGDGIIVRLYEAARERGPVALKAGFPVKSAERVNLLEEPMEGPVSVEDGAVRFTITPYEIVTLRLK